MFDDNVSGEVPEHRDFIYNVAIPRFQNDFGIQVDVVKSPVTYVERFCGLIAPGHEWSGYKRGFPLCGRCWVQRDCKAKALDEYWKQMPESAVSLVGIRKDEDYRLFKKYGRQRISYLYDNGITKAHVPEITERYGLRSPIYKFAPRNGCWFCPNAKDAERRHLQDHHPKYWKMLEQLEKTPGQVPKTFDRSLSVANILENFYWEDQQITFDEIVRKEQT